MLVDTGQRAVDLALNIFVMRAVSHDALDYNTSLSGLFDRSVLFPFKRSRKAWDNLMWANAATKHPMEAALFPELDLLRTQLLLGRRICVDP